MADHADKWSGALLVFVWVVLFIIALALMLLAIHFIFHRDLVVPGYYLLFGSSVGFVGLGYEAKRASGAGRHP
tara:strand:+ start:888 stop:1106 length:219 start_codon:yes stop_codon:yes gene_type:complete